MGLRLSVGQRIRLGFLVMVLLVLVASGTGFRYSTSVEQTVNQAQEGLVQVSEVTDLELALSDVAGTVDNILITRQTGLVEEELQPEVNDFILSVADLQFLSLGNDPELAAANRDILVELAALSGDLEDTVDSIVAAARETLWGRAQTLRHTEMTTLQRRLNVNLSQLRANIVEDVDISVEEALQVQRRTRAYWIGSSVAAMVLAVVLAILITYTIARPVDALSERVERVMERDFSPVQPLPQRDEIGDLSRAFALMTEWLRESYETLEQRVAHRTLELERRTVQLESSAEVARSAAAIRDVNALMDAVVQLVSEKFGFYHAGIFLIDDRREYAVLRAASSAGGADMLIQGHRLRVGEVGIVGYVSASGESRVALDVGEDAYFFDNPYLPDTRSEMALPLKARGEIIGVLDVQSRASQAFSEEDVRTLQTMADQLALAIENARLLASSREAYEELQRLYGRRAREAWKDLLHRSTRAFRYTGVGVESVSPTETPADETDDGHLLRVPLSLRDLDLGVLVLRREPEEPAWNAEERALVRSIATQASLALDKARLIEETERRAVREELIGEIAARLRESLDIDTVLQMAAREIGESMELAEVTVHMRSDTKGPGGEEQGQGPEEVTA